LAVWTTVQLLLNDGDNFLFPSPGFPASATIARTINAQPRLYYLSSDNNWQADIKQMESLIDERTRFIYINDPSNPLGSCWSN
jgi:tyrosine aminotransferase